MALYNRSANTHTLGKIQSEALVILDRRDETSAAYEFADLVRLVYLEEEDIFVPATYQEVLNPMMTETAPLTDTNDQEIYPVNMQTDETTTEAASKSADHSKRCRVKKCRFKKDPSAPFIAKAEADQKRYEKEEAAYHGMDED
ncbi:hypothetical protein K450DRAFT_273010 [Umbelopsis ramanniana AG]|uniref:Uncharacterized protein n=1 Tax=Umbelopsis ramanniana AG TaxID=1314678 RepID=A0AAD5EA21_UMBRA|nr:uncharacterized protein K450DRAFT_273010 [Umbelopsis ramanniana AG]KAI8578410.1 hypothetical protein K450DRAFT_273010 [Umbelopsis ramanniana AG]